MLPEKIGPYEIESEIGHGATATVYRAADGQRRRTVAVKVLRPEYATDLGYRARFERETQTIATLEHDAIVPLLDFGQYEGQLYIAMPYMAQGTLDHRLLQGPLPLEDTARILGRVGAALDYAHGRGVIHRDLKPSNILFDAEGQAFLSDFGIATSLDDDGDARSLFISGTPAYMSPEQAHREQSVDGRSDLYALGVIVFQMVTGALPYKGDNPIAVLWQHIHDTAPAPSDLNPGLPAALDQVLRKALAGEPARRFQSVGTFVAAFQKATSAETASGEGAYGGRASDEAGEVEETGVRAVEDHDGAPGEEETPAPALVLAAEPTSTATPAPPARKEDHRPSTSLRALLHRLRARQRLLRKSIWQALETIRAGAGPQLEAMKATLEERPRAAFALVALLGVFCAAGATLAFRGPALRETIRAGAVALASPPTALSKMYLPIAVARSVPTPTAAAPAGEAAFSAESEPTTDDGPAPEANLLVIYTETALTVINVSGANLSLAGLTFQRAGGESSPDAVFSTDEWRRVAGGTVGALPPGDCFQLVDLGSSGRGRGPERPAECEKLQGWLATSRADRIFFRPEGANPTFQVFQGDRQLHSCVISEGQCRFYVPQQ